MTHAIKSHYWTMYNKLHDSVWGVPAAFLVVFLSAFFLTEASLTVMFAVYLAFIFPLPYLRWSLLFGLLGIACVILTFVLKKPFSAALAYISILASFGCVIAHWNSIKIGLTNFRSFLARWDLFKITFIIGTIAIVAYYIFSGILIKAVGVLVLVACYGTYFVVSRTVFTVNLNSGGQSRRRYSRRKKPSTASTA